MEEEDQPARHEGESPETPGTSPPPDPPPAAEWEESGRAQGYWAVEEQYSDQDTYQPAAGSGTGRATAAMVLGIVGLIFTVCCCGGGMFGLISSIVAWVLGHQEVKAIQQGRSNWEGLGQARAGMIMGIIGTILNGLIMLGGILFYAFYFAVIIAAAASGA
ncbi:MAG: hypothetical protein ACYS47_04420 [Planctomycetota bacterium]